MAMINPVHGLIVPFLCVFTIPLAIFAGITTTIAFSILMFRVALVYLNIAMNFIPQYLMGRSRYRRLPSTHGYLDDLDDPIPPVSPANSAASGSGRKGPPLTPPAMMYSRPGQRSPKPRERGGGVLFNGFSNNTGGPSGPALGRRSRHPSQGSMASVGTITPINETDDGPLGSSSGSWALRSSGMGRDFEGVGGWRLDDRGDDADWANINSRLELPLERVQRHHHRTPSGDPPGLDGGWLMMKGSRKDRSPDAQAREWNTSSRWLNTPPSSGRVRPSQNLGGFTPRDREEGYFGYFPKLPSPKATKKPSL